MSVIEEKQHTVQFYFNTSKRATSICFFSGVNLVSVEPIEGTEEIIENKQKKRPFQDACYQPPSERNKILEYSSESHVLIFEIYTS